MEHVTRWLQAYYDGGIPDHKSAAIEAHLTQCETCRAALAELEALSGLLHSAPAPKMMPEERFVAQIGLKLPRRPAPSRMERAFVTSWQLAPVALLGAWVIVQAILWVAPLANAVLGVNPSQGLVAWLTPAPGASGWLNGLLGGLGVAWGAQVLGILNFISEIAVISVGVPLVFGILIWSWLALGWAYRRHQQLVANGEQP